MKKEDFDIKVFARRLSQLIDETEENTYTLADRLGLTPATISRYANGRMAPKVPTLYAMADIFGVNPIWLFGFDVPKYEEKGTLTNFPPNITNDYVTFPVIGEVAAGYDHIAVEDWEGDTVDIPISYLKGRKKDEFFVLRVKGESMYPMYHDGDKVLVLKQQSMDHSGQVGVVLYNGDLGTLKKVEYIPGEDWMRLVPINPSVPPTTITGADLEQCKVLGVPKLLIRELEQ